MKKLLIITGPQGSGNHLFSRLLSLHPDVQGWDEMLDNYWVPSDQEPFAEYWVNPEKLGASHFDGRDYHLANVSCPFFFDGTRHVPKLRVRKEHTMPIAQKYYYETLLPSGFPVHFLDHEAFFLHTTHYLKWASQVLSFPIDYDNPDIMKFISEDANHKYIKYIDEHWLDEYVLAGCKPTRDARLNK